MPPLATYWHTLRHLRPVQLYGRVWFRLARPRVDGRPAPRVRARPSRDWTAPAAHAITLVAPDRFCMLNQSHSIAERGWDDPQLDKLWRYNLHYFDDLSAGPAADRTAWQRALLSRWVAENPPGIGTGWDPYPTSLRIVNWIKWAHAGNPLPVECVQSLAVQVRWLARRLEWHLLGNHLFANAKALVFAGTYFDGAEAEAWLAQGLDILAREIPEQILVDGGHFERSPMYHALAVEDMLDLVNVTRTYADLIPRAWRAAVANWTPRIAAMRRWMLAMRHPDGEIGFFNDAAIGVAPAPSAIEAYAERLGLGTSPPSADRVTSLEPSGYIRVEDGPLVALLDVAPVGPEYLPAHAHADTLSFELSMYGQRLFVNSGTSCYGFGAERLRQRGTAAHNTVIVNDVDSSEVWSGFRVARRARPVGLSLTMHPDVVVSCAHDGYRRLPGRPEHRRQWTFSGGMLTVEDRLTGSFGSADARFHLHPDVAVTDVVDRRHEVAVTLRLPRGQRARFSVTRGSLRLEPATWHPEFGLAVANQCLVVRLDGGTSRIHLTWAGDA